jgi:hypothetical protein
MLDSLSCSFISISFLTKCTYDANTIATASFKTLSPKTNANRSTSTFRSLNMDRTEIGSVAEITAPNQKQSFRVNIPEMSAIALVRPYIIPLKQNKIIIINSPL